ncbi:MAG: CNNM domain-containing protein [Candidatus Gygaella obscura]|nr:CNNM domain-containing protein [Candidatus Gygaella obscura]
MEGLFNLPVVFFTLVILVILSMFFALSETAFVALNKLRLRQLLKKKVKGAQSAQRVFSKMDQLISLILIGNNFVNIAISALVTSVFIFKFGPKWGVLIATFCVGIFIVIFCEIIPKLFAIQYSKRTALVLAPFLEYLIKLFSPLVSVFASFSNFVLRIFGGKPQKRIPLLSEEELRIMIELGREEGVVTEQELKILHKTFDFSDLKAKDILISKDEIVAVNIKDSASELMRILVEEGHSRIPAYEGTIDNVKGIIYARDLLYLLSHKDLFLVSDIVHPAYFIEGDKKISELLKEFQQKKLQIAIVTDSVGRTLGLVTLEDLLEEIVGEIEEDTFNIPVR